MVVLVVVLVGVTLIPVMELLAKVIEVVMVQAQVTVVDKGLLVAVVVHQQ
jgi:hypothetical protein